MPIGCFLDEIRCRWRPCRARGRRRRSESGSRTGRVRTPAWSFYEGTEVLRQLAASLDERGVRERALKDALADHAPVFGLDDVDD